MAYNVPAQAISGSNGSFLFSTVTFGNLNGLSFYTSNGSIVGSYTDGGGGGGAALSAGTQSVSTGTVAFANSNGITFGMSNSNQITASHNGLTSQSNQAFSAQGGSSAFQTLVFTNSNGVSFSNTNGSIWASHNGLTSQSNQAFSAQGGSSAFQTLVFTNSNGISFSNTNGSIWASHNALTTARASNDAVGLNTAQTNVTWTVNSNGLSLNAAGYAGTGTSATNASITLNSNGLAISVAAPGGGGAINVSAGTTSNNLQTVVFSNSNGVSFGLNGSTITASTNTAATMPMAGGTQANFVSYLSFHDNANMSWQLSSDGGNLYSNSIVGTPYINFSAGTTSGNLSALTFSNSNGVSFGINGGTLTASVGAGGGGGYTALSLQNRQLGASTTINSVGGQNSLWMAPVRVAAPVSASTILAAMISYSGTITSAATAQAGQTLRVGIWAQHTDPASSNRFDTWWTGAASLTFWNSGTSSVSYAYSQSGGQTTGSSAGSNLMTASVMGARQIIFPINSTMSAGLYVIGLVNSTSSAGYSAAMSRMALYMDNPLSLGQGAFGQATNNSIGYADGGTYGTTTGGLPASIELSQIKQQANVMPYFKIGAL